MGYNYKVDLWKMAAEKPKLFLLFLAKLDNFDLFKRSTQVENNKFVLNYSNFSTFDSFSEKKQKK